MKSSAAVARWQHWFQWRQVEQKPRRLPRWQPGGGVGASSSGLVVLCFEVCQMWLVLSLLKQSETTNLMLGIMTTSQKIAQSNWLICWRMQMMTDWRLTHKANVRIIRPKFVSQVDFFDQKMNWTSSSIREPRVSQWHIRWCNGRILKNDQKQWQNLNQTSLLLWTWNWKEATIVSRLKQ